EGGPAGEGALTASPIVAPAAPGARTDSTVTPTLVTNEPAPAAELTVARDEHADVAPARERDAAPAAPRDAAPEPARFDPMAEPAAAVTELVEKASIHAVKPPPVALPPISSTLPADSPLALVETRFRPAPEPHAQAAGAARP